MAVVCACIALAGLATSLIPRRYESEMKFLVNNERADLVITPDKGSNYAPPVEVTETAVNSEIELLKGQDLLESIVRDQQLYNPPGKKKISQPSPMAIASATRTLSHDLNIAALRKTNIISVTYRSTDPDRAVAVLHDLGDRYLTAHLAAHSTPGTYNFFTQQVYKYSQQLTRIRVAISEFHRQKKLFSLPQQQTAVIEQLENVEGQLKSVTADIREQQTRLSESQAQLSAVPERATTQVRSVPNQYAAEHLQSTLADLRNKRIELAMKFKPGDRFLVELGRQIATTESELAEVQAAKATEQTTDLDTLHQSLKADYARGQITVRALEARRSELAAIRESYLSELDNMDQNSSLLQNLELHEKETLDNYTLYSSRVDEARLADSLDQQKFSNVVMTEKPVSSPIPVSPNLSLNLAVGALMGAFFSFALAFFLESKGSRPAAEPDAHASQNILFEPRAFQAQASGD